MWRVIGISPRGLYFICHVNTWCVGHVWWVLLKRRTVAVHASCVKQSLGKWMLLEFIICDVARGVAAQCPTTSKLYSSQNGYTHLRGYAVTWQAATWLHSYASICLRGYAAVRLSGYAAKRICGYASTWLRGYASTRLRTNKANWLHGYVFIGYASIG